VLWKFTKTAVSNIKDDQYNCVIDGEKDENIRVTTLSYLGRFTPIQVGSTFLIKFGRS
jgi:hypothetical protein